MRTYIRALVTLNAVFGDPFGNINGNAALLISGSALRKRTVGKVDELGNRKRIPLHLCNGKNDITNEFNELGTIACDFLFSG